MAFCYIVSINPLREAGLIAFRHPQEVFAGATHLTDLFLQIRVNGDVAMASAERDIEQAICIILETAPGERAMRPDFLLSTSRIGLPFQQR